MVRRALRSRSLRRVYRKVPGGRVSLQFKDRKAKAASCATCGVALKGMPKTLPSKKGSLSKSSARPSRLYGGKLCSSCTRRLIINSTRGA